MDHFAGLDRSSSMEQVTSSTKGSSSTTSTGRTNALSRFQGSLAAYPLDSMN
jgi:hypothetical protein